MNPHFIDWSNIPDYLTKEEFLEIAQKMGNEKTIHYMHSLLWQQQTRPNGQIWRELQLHCTVHRPANARVLVRVAMHFLR